MSQNKKPRERATPPDAKRRRQRLPVLTSLRFDDALAANENHPLAATPAHVREDSRLRLIAGILARIAKAAMNPSG